MIDISSQIGVSTHSSKTNNEMWESRGWYTLHFCKTNNRGVGIGEDTVFWHDSKRDKMQLKVSDLFILATATTSQRAPRELPSPSLNEICVLIRLSKTADKQSFLGTPWQF
jgi:hypothetical protein